MNSNLITSIVRTIVPVIVGALLTVAAKVGLDIDHDELSAVIGQLVTVIVSAAYYAVARVAETRFGTQWGWLLGHPSAPSYNAEG